MKFSALERRWIVDIFDTMYPRSSDPTLPLGVRDCDIKGYLDDIEKRWPSFSLFGYRATVVVIGLASIVLLRTWRTFHRLTTDERLKVLTAIYASRFYVVRQLVILLKASAGIVYGSEPRVRQQLLHGDTEGRARYGIARTKEA
jgi:hypothetical protein